MGKNATDINLELSVFGVVNICMLFFTVDESNSQHLLVKGKGVDTKIVMLFRVYRSLNNNKDTRLINN